MKHLRTSFFVVFYVFVSLMSSAYAQEEPAAAVPAVTQLDVNELINTKKVSIKDMQSLITDTEKKLNDAPQDSDVLKDITANMRDLSGRAISEAVAFRQPLIDLNLKIDQLGAVQEGEAQAVTDERTKLKNERNLVNETVAAMEQISLKSAQLLSNATLQRRNLFAARLTEKVVFDEGFFQRVDQGAKQAGSSFLAIVSSWWNNAAQYNFIQFVSAIFIPLLPVFVTFFWMRRRKAFMQQQGGEDPTFLQRIAYALFSVVISTFVIICFVLFSSYLLDIFGLITADMQPFFKALANIFIFVFFVGSLANAILSPHFPKWSLLPKPLKSGYFLVFVIVLIALALGMKFILDTVYTLTSTPVSVVIANGYFFVLVVGILVLLAAFIRPFKNIETGKKQKWPRWFSFLLVLIGLGPIVLASFGYVGFAQFMVVQLIVWLSFVSLMLLGIMTGKAIAAEGSFGQTKLGVVLGKKFSLSDETIDQYGFILGTLLIIFSIVLCTIPILFLYGFSSGDVWRATKQFFTGFQIGNISISLVGIAIGLMVFFITWAISRWLVNWLDVAVMARGRVDSGVRNSIKTVAGYCGIIIAILIGLSVTGVSFTSFALIAGGLSLGVGFGLQTIVQNFVSGLILLAERPFKVGDYIETGTIKGTVSKIRVRTTEIETGNKITIVIPNSSLINNNVGNWTHRNRMGRLDIPFVLSSKHDPKTIYDILLKIANETEGILVKPMPYVTFSDFKPSESVCKMKNGNDNSFQYNFQLSVYVPDITSTTALSNKLRFAVFDSLKPDGDN